MKQVSDRLVERATYYVTHPDLDDDTVQADAESKLQEAVRIIDRHDDGDALERYIAQHIRDHHDAYRDGRLDIPPCECNDPECDLKNGSVPSKLRRRGGFYTDAPTMTRLITEYKMSHPEEQAISDAEEDWSDQLDDAQSLLFDVIRTVRNHV